MTMDATRGVLLLADDEEFIRVGLGELLRRSGFDCVAVVGGAEALAQLGAREYDALITDIHMPGNTRLELTEAARRLVPGLPVVLLTGRPSVETAARSVRLPVTAYLTKPPNLDELEAILDEAIADYRGFRAMEAGRARLAEWQREIERVAAALRATRTQGEGGPMGSYLRLTLRQVILMLSDLEKATQAFEGAPTAGAREVDREAALRRTVEVLERTKQNFKSKELAGLRKQIEELLAKPEAGAGDGPG